MSEENVKHELTFATSDELIDELRSRTEVMVLGFVLKSDAKHYGVRIHGTKIAVLGMLEVTRRDVNASVDEMKGKS